MLAMLAVLTSQALHITSRGAPRPLHSSLARIRTMVPPVEADRLLGPELGEMAHRFTAHVTTIEDA